MPDNPPPPEGPPSDGSVFSAATSFWKTLPGIITATTTLVAALTALISGLNSAGLLGSHGGSLKATENGKAVETASAAPPDHDTGLKEYRVGQMSDGFAAVREQPTVASRMVSRLESGSHVDCGDLVEDVTGVEGRLWLSCPNVGGYIASRLLIPL
ncbi:hypothetical protein [Novosphingobium beihaiensis]|uniref:SH3 domain-containing protein n=1 Tax=Novosphingobium beihaiensis TaxID=2930389 RepID=A0ABT0BUI1_9SPHN|nr:hypothetical protein [Novosphingobium beihaiensis]MCJ2188687.1 hypothetical protein [Novosphingobium beihaiensis]